MSGREFIDTNVLVYADDARDQRKQTCAHELIRCLMRERRGVLSLQIQRASIFILSRVAKR